MATMTEQERSRAVQDIAAVLLDGSRIDRYVRLDSHGKPYTTDAAEYLGPDGPYNTPYVRLPNVQGESEEDATSWAEMILDELLNAPQG